MEIDLWSYTRQQLYTTLSVLIFNNQSLYKKWQKDNNYGTIPNRTMKKGDLIDYLEEFQQLASKQSKIIIKKDQFECPICFKTIDEGLQRCLISSHTICNECAQQQQQSINLEKTCPICRQDRFEQIICYCFKGDRKNINKDHIKKIISQLDIQKIIQNGGKYKYKWIDITILNNTENYSIFLITDRYQKERPQEKEDFVQIDLD